MTKNETAAWMLAIVITIAVWGNALSDTKMVGQSHDRGGYAIFGALMILGMGIAFVWKRLK